MNTATKQLSTLDIQSLRKSGRKIGCITAYDFPFAAICDAAGADLILVGDSLGTTVQGHPDTIPVTLEQMIYHTTLVSRAVKHALVVADMPFMSYQLSSREALASAGRLVKEGGAAAVKLEGGKSAAAAIRRIVRAGIPVMGHIGLTPQSVNAFGGYRVQGRGSEEARKVMDDARAVETAGAFSVVLECVPADLAAEITASLSIPTIGIGAGVGCSGQILVLHDLLGLSAEPEKPLPRFVRRYADLHQTTAKAIAEYLREVREETFPARAESY